MSCGQPFVRVLVSTVGHKILVHSNLLNGWSQATGHKYLATNLLGTYITIGNLNNSRPDGAVGKLTASLVG